jgi:hypothetical protein
MASATSHRSLASSPLHQPNYNVQYQKREPHHPLSINQMEANLPFSDEVDRLVITDRIRSDGCLFGIPRAVFGPAHCHRSASHLNGRQIPSKSKLQLTFGLRASDRPGMRTTARQMTTADQRHRLSWCSSACRAPCRTRRCASSTWPGA